MAGERLGAIALRLELITPRQLQEAMVMQVELENKTGKSMLIGEILVKLNCLTEKQLSHLMSLMAKEGLHTSLKQPKSKNLRSEFYDSKGISYYA